MLRFRCLQATITLMLLLSAAVAFASGGQLPSAHSDRNRLNVASALTWKRSPVWTGGQAGPQDGNGRYWHVLLFDDSSWGDVLLPDTDLDFSADDRYYRAHFTWNGLSVVTVYFMSDDGLTIYINGNPLGSWGNGWRQSGCVNSAPTCVNSIAVPVQTVPTSMLQSGDNVIAVDLWNAATCCFYFLNVVLNEATDPDRALAERFAPYMYFHQDDIYRPIALAEPLAQATLANYQVGHYQFPVTLADLMAAEWNLDSTYINLPGDGPQEVRNKYLEKVYPQVVLKAFARVDRTITPGQVAVQYWLYYYDNPWYNHHEGDWEMAQVVLDSNANPRYATFAQHLGGSRRQWSDVQKIGEHPVVYVARGSHASYFGPYSYFQIGIDKTAPTVAMGVIPIEMLPESETQNTWPYFKGHWGNERIWWDLFDQDGPSGPPWQRDKWDNPVAWSEGQPWDEYAPYNLIGKFNVTVPSPLDAHVYQLPSLAHVGWKDGQVELGIPDAEYFDNTFTRWRTILLHTVDSQAQYQVKIDLRLPVLQTEAQSVSEAITATIHFPDIEAGTIITASYALTGTWGVSTTAVISVHHGSSFNMMIDADGDGTMDEQVVPGTLEGSLFDFVSPAPITNLAVVTSTTEGVVLTWRAPGDDQNTGKAFAYDIRRYTVPITDTNWVSSTLIISPPMPSTAGTTEVFTVTDVPGGVHYFAIQAIDDVLRSSPLSNVVQANIPHRLYLPLVMRSP